MKPALCLLSLLLFTGCIPILIHAGVEASSREQAAYSAYLDNLRLVNLEREQGGLAVEPPMTRENWRRTLQPSKPVPKSEFKPKHAP